MRECDESILLYITCICVYAFLFTQVCNATRCVVFAKSNDSKNETNIIRLFHMYII